MSAVCRQCLDGIGDGRSAGRNSQGCSSALKRGNSLLQHVLGGVGQTSVDIARIRQAEAVSGVFAVVEHIGCGLIDRDRSGIRRRIRLLLSHMQL